MPAHIQFPFIFGVPVLPARRVIAIDPGSRNLKVVMAEAFLNRVRIVHRELVPIPETDPSPAEAAAEQLAQTLCKLGDYPLALVLPQHITHSQIVDLPVTSQAEVARLVQNEAYKLAGLSQSKMAYDHCPLHPFGRHANPFWITLCQENEVFSLLENLKLERENICDATSTGNALMASYLRMYPDTTATVLVDLGMRSTTLAILIDGQGAHAASFALGNEMFLETLAQNLQITIPEAEKLQREQSLLAKNKSNSAYVEIVETWRQELHRLVNEWLIEQVNLKLSLVSFQFILCGGAARQPGFIEYLNRAPDSPAFLPWPGPEDSDEDSAEAGLFAVAEGAALHALGKSLQSASLLPLELRKNWQNQRTSQIVQSLSFMLLLVAAMLLAFGAWQKSNIINRKTAMLGEIQSVWTQIRNLEDNRKKLAGNFEAVRPLLERQQFTYDTLQTLALLQQTRANRSFWHVLFADAQTYFSAPPVGATNEPPPAEFSGPVLPSPFPPPPTLSATTNRPPVKLGFVAELCIPEEGEAMRRTLSQVVTELKKNARFKSVDVLPPEQRRTLAEPKAVIPDRHFALFLELETNEFLSLPAISTNAPPVPPASPARATIATPQPVIAWPKPPEAKP